MAAQWYEQAGLDEGTPEDWQTADDVELPLKLKSFQIAAESDPAFDDQWHHWLDFACQFGILLPIEQSCHEGILLPTDQRAMRLASCPEDMLKPLRRFFEDCPNHVKHLLSHYVYWVVRLERARRTGTADWRPRAPASSS